MSPVKRSLLAALFLLMAVTPAAGQVGVLDQPYRNDPFQPILDGGWSFTHHLSLGFDNNTMGVGDAVAVGYLVDDFRPSDIFLVAGLVPAGEGVRLGTQERTGITIGFPAGNYVTLAVTAGGRVLGTGHIPDGVAALARDGVTGDELTVDLTEMGGEVFGFGEGGLLGLAEFPVLRTPLGRMNVMIGAGARYLYGVSHVRFGFSGSSGEETSAFTLSRAGVSSALHLTVPVADEILAESGGGFGFDAMVGASIPGRGQLRIAVTDLGSADLTVGATEAITVTLDEVSFTELGEATDAATVTDTVPGGVRSVPLPTTFRADASFRPLKAIGLGAKLAIPLTDEAPALEPRVQAGVELRPVGVLPLRLGLFGGGQFGAGYFAGLGLDTGGFRFDLELAFSGGPELADIRGVGFRSGLALQF